MRVRGSDIVTGDAASVMPEAEGGMYVVVLLVMKTVLEFQWDTGPRRLQKRNRRVPVFPLLTLTG